MKKNITALTALLSITPVRMDEGEQRETMTRAEWSALEKQRLADKSTEQLIEQLVQVKADNHDLRRKAAPEGSVILDAEQAKRWQAWEALGKPEDVTKSLEQAKKDREFVVRTERRQQLNAVAEAAGWDVEAFSDLDSLAGGLEWTVSEVKGSDGNSVKSVTVKVDGKDVDAQEFAKQRWGKFLPVLQIKTEESQEQDTQTTEPVIVRIPTGGASGGKPRSYSQSDAEKRLTDSGSYDM